MLGAYFLRERKWEAEKLAGSMFLESDDKASERSATTYEGFLNML